MLTIKVNILLQWRGFKVILFDNKILLLVASLALTACSSKYAPLTGHSKHAGGYQEWQLTEKPLINTTEKSAKVKRKKQAIDTVQNNSQNSARYLLRYQGTSRDSKARITGYWHQRATELCPIGYKVAEHKQSLVQGFVESPINGRLEKLVTFQPIDNGIIQCVNKSK